MQKEFLFTRKSVVFQFVMGALWLLIAILSLLKDEMRFIDYGYWFLAVVYLVMGVVAFRKDRITVTDTTLRLNGFFPVEIQRSNLKEVDYRVGSYIFYDGVKEIQIPKSHIRKEERDAFQQLYEQMVSEKNSLKQ